MSENCGHFWQFKISPLAGGLPRIFGEFALAAGQRMIIPLRDVVSAARQGSLPAEVRTAPKSGIAVASQFPERSISGAALDCSRNSLRQEEPPRNDLSGVHDHVDVLIEQVAFDDGGRGFVVTGAR
jgi:hypothetical protein